MPTASEHTGFRKTQLESRINQQRDLIRLLEKRRRSVWWAMHAAEEIFMRQRINILKVCHARGVPTPETYDAPLKREFIEDEDHAFYREFKRVTDEDTTFAEQQEAIDGIVAKMRAVYTEVDRMTTETRALQSMVHLQEDVIQLMFTDTEGSYHPNPYTTDAFKSLSPERPKLAQNRFHGSDQFDHMNDQLDQNDLDAQNMEHAMAGTAITIKIQREAMAWQSGSIIRIRNPYIKRENGKERTKPYEWKGTNTAEEDYATLQVEGLEEASEKWETLEEPDEPPSNTTPKNVTSRPELYEPHTGMYSRQLTQSEDDPDQEWDPMPIQDDPRDTTAPIFHRYFTEETYRARRTV